MNDQVPPILSSTVSSSSKTSRLAIARIALGGICCLVMILIVVACIFPLSLNIDRELARRVRCLTNMKAVSLAIAMYAEENDGKIPLNLQSARKYCTSDRILICPSSRDRKTTNYQILLGGKKWKSPETMDAIVMSEPLANHHGGRNALYGDGHVEFSGEQQDSSLSR